jgi:hypothetical protein
VLLLCKLDFEVEAGWLASATEPLRRDSKDANNKIRIARLSMLMWMVILFSCIESLHF